MLNTLQNKNNLFHSLFFSDSDHSKTKKKKKRSEKPRQKSMSPLSKRMALISGSDVIAADTTSSGYNYPQSFSGSGITGLESIPNEYDLRVKRIANFNLHICSM